METPLSFDEYYEATRLQLEFVKQRAVEEVRAVLDGLGLSAQDAPLEARVKDKAGAYLKLQSGKYADLFCVPDLVGMRVSLLHPSQYPEVATALKAHPAFVSVEEDRLEAPDPASFAYGQPHLVVKLAENALLKAEGEAWPNVLVEIQLSTWLQTALNKTTHAIYKGSEYSWARSRFETQLRGVLELVDLLFDDVVGAPNAVLTERPYPIYDRRNLIITALQEIFDPADLPVDLCRLSQVAERFLEAADIDVDSLGILAQENAAIVDSVNLNVADKLLALAITRASAAGKVDPQFLDRVGLHDRKMVVPRELNLLCPEAASIPAGVRVRLPVD